LSREILSGGPIIPADPFCRGKFHILPRKIYFLHVPHDPFLDLLFPCAYFVPPKDFLRSFYFRVIFV
jgi:hypothetical protein